MKKGLIVVLLSLLMTFEVIADSHERWNLKAKAGTNYALTGAIFGEGKGYTNNYTWYPGLDIGPGISYNVFPWLAFESGLDFERIRTGYRIGISGQNGITNVNYVKDYFNVPLLILLKASTNFGVFVGSGYRYCLNKSIAMETLVDWHEWQYTGGFFVNVCKVRMSLSYSQGKSEKTFIYSRNRIISITAAYTLWKR